MPGNKATKLEIILIYGHTAANFNRHSIKGRIKKKGNQNSTSIIKDKVFFFFPKLILPKSLHWNINNKKTEILHKHILLGM